MLGAADVEIDRHPVALDVGRPRLSCVVRIAEAEEVPAGPGPLRHRVGLATIATAVAHHLDPLRRFCERRLDRRIEHALDVQSRDPAAANELWADLDHEITDKAAWLPLYNVYGADLVSKRVGNYQHNPQWGALLSQMWVR